MKLKQFRISLESMVKCRKSPVCTCTVPSHSIDMFYRWQCINHDLYFYQHHSYHLYQSISYPYVIYVMDAMSPPWPLLDFAWLELLELQDGREAFGEFWRVLKPGKRQP